MLKNELISKLEKYSEELKVGAEEYIYEEYDYDTRCELIVFMKESENILDQQVVLTSLYGDGTEE